MAKEDTMIIIELINDTTIGKIFLCFKCGMKPGWNNTIIFGEAVVLTNGKPLEIKISSLTQKNL